MKHNGIPDGHSGGHAYGHADGHAERAITCHELYVLYSLSGYSKVTPDPGRLAVSRPNPDQLLREFKNLTRNLARGVLAGRADLDLFKAAETCAHPPSGALVSLDRSLPHLSTWRSLMMSDLT